MITVDFSKRKNTPLYEFLYESIKDAVLKGELTADEKLPSQRHLSLHLGISIITVRAAYERLIDEGFIYSIEKKGFYITKLSIKKVFLDTQKIKK